MSGTKYTLAMPVYLESSIPWQCQTVKVRLLQWFANLFVLTGLFIGQCRVGQFMVQNCKVVHWPDKQPETAGLKWLIRDESIQSSALSYPHSILLLLLTISCPV
jgi:hypothetical protein